MALAEHPLDLIHDLRHLFRGFRGEESGPDGPHELGAHDLSLGGRERNEDHVVLIAPPRIVPLGNQPTDNLERNVLEPNGGPHRVFTRTKQILGDRVADQRDLGGRVVVGLGEKVSAHGGPATNNQIASSHAVDRREPVLVFMDDLHRVATGPADIRHTGNLSQFFYVGSDQRHRPAMAGSHARGGRGARQDRDHVGAEGGDLGLHSGLGALSDADHRDDGPHPDDDAQHRQHRPHPVPAQHTERHQHRHQKKIHMPASDGMGWATATPSLF